MFVVVGNRDILETEPAVKNGAADAQGVDNLRDPKSTPPNRSSGTGPMCGGRNPHERHDRAGNIDERRVSASARAVSGGSGYQASLDRTAKRVD